MFPRCSLPFAAALGWACLLLNLHAAENRSEVVFTDRRQEAGITFQHHANPTPDKYLIETMGGGVGVLDFDNDGWLDIFFVNSGGLVEGGEPAPRIDRSRPEFFHRLYRNKHDGSFVDVTEKAGLTGSQRPLYGMGVATGDYDNDGFVDLYLTHFGGTLLYRNDGDGTFTDTTAAAGVNVPGWSASAGFVDFNHDGHLDIFVTRYLDWDFSSRIECGETFRVYCTPKKYEAVSNVLFQNNGDGTFRDISESSGIAGAKGKALGVAFNDYDGDGLVDIAVANDSTAQFLFRNQGDGTFSEEALPAGLAFNEDGGIYSGMGIDFEDYDNDGRPDIIITNLAKELYAIYRNDGSGNFTYVTRQSHLGQITNRLSGWGVWFFDYDHDGWKDLFAAQSHVLDNIEKIEEGLVYQQPPLLARNNQGRFEDVSSKSGAAFRRDIAGRGAAFGDLDNDGDIDIVLAVLNDHPLVLYSNASESARHWLMVRLQGSQSNHDGQGAAIKVVSASGDAQWRFASTAGSYLSANGPRVHFGLGSDDVIEWLEIRWPSGTKQVLRNVRADQILTVVEPEE